MPGSYYEVAVVPNAKGWSAKLEAQIGAPMRQLAEDFKRQFSDAARGAFDGVGARLRASIDPATRSAADNLRDQLRRAVNDGLNEAPGNSSRQGNQSGRQYGDAFTRQVQSKLQAALRNLPDVQVRADTSAVDRELINVRRELASTVGQLELGVDPSSVDRQVAELKARLQALATNTTDVRVRVNTTAALAEVEAFQVAMRGEGKDSGVSFVDNFTRQIQTRLRAANSSLPEIRIDANSGPADRELAYIRSRLKALGDAKIGVDIDDTAAVVQIDELRLRLARLTAPGHDIRMRVNSGAALAELAALKLAIGETTESGNALSRVGSGIATGFASTPVGAIALTAAIAAAASTVGPLVAAATGGVLGLAGAAGVAALAFKGLQKDIKDGTGVGITLKRDLDGVKGEIDSLASAAARVVAPVAHDLLGGIRSALPGFQPIVELIAGKLGNAAGNLGTTLISAAQKASPLFADVASYIETGAQKLGDWVASPSFDEFLDYARQQLPIIIGYVGDFGKALVDTFVALAPAGETVLKILDYIAKGISATSSLLSANGLSLLGGLIGTDDERKKADDTTSIIDNMIASLKQTTTQSAAVSSVSSGIAASLGVTNAAYRSASDAASGTAAQLAATTLQMQVQGDAAGLLRQALDQLSGKNLGVAETLNSFQSQLLSLDDTFAKGAFSATAYNDAAVAQRGALLSAVTAAQTHAQAIATQTGSTAAGTAALRADIDAIVASTGATGANSAAVRGYITSISAIPVVKRTALEINTATATAAVNNFKSLYQHLPPSTVTISANLSEATAAVQRFVSTPRVAYVQVQTSGPSGPSGGKALLNAYGGYYDRVPAYAHGGIAGGVADGLARKISASAPRFAMGSENHVPQIARPGKFARIWAEPETQGEAYIPFALDRRARAEDILSQVAEKFGGEYTRHHAASQAAASSLTSASTRAGASSNQGSSAPSLLGVQVTIDAGSVGTLTGHISKVSDSRIANREDWIRRVSVGGPASVLK